MQKTSNYDLLNNEAATSAGMIGTGLTLLRKMDFTKESYQCQAFFCLSIGLERMMKLILIYDYRTNNNNQFPSDNFFKQSYGHNLNKLLSACKGIGNHLKINTNINDRLYDTIIEILTKFSTQSRYYNLNYLTGNLAGEDCTHLWEQQVNMEILKRHCNSPADYSEEDEQIVIAPDSTMEERLQNATVINFKNWHRKGQFFEEKAIYSTLYTYRIVNYLAILLHYLAAQKLLPFINEHYRLFIGNDEKFIMEQKVWNPYDLHQAE
jgi:hypothetical protein